MPNSKSKKEGATIDKNAFPKNFVWGVSTAAYQIEGAYNADDKGTSIWDQFVLKKGAIYGGQTAQVACDFYHRYQEDILLMKSMNIKNFRFSLAWTRIIPEGQGTVSQAGIDFYNRIIDFCLKQDIVPWVTLYHWDLPQALEDKGGWSNREVLQWFENYVEVCTKAFGDRVKNWMVLNEPMVFTGAGYFLGVHAPGKKGLQNFLPAVHYATLSQALGGRIIRKNVPNANIGTTFSCSQITPNSDKKKDLRAVEKADALLNRLFVEPTLGLGYPVKSVPVLEKIRKYIQPGDMENCLFDFDFIGIQNYTREVVRHSYTVPYLRAKIVKATKRKVQTTLMDWEVYPPSIYEMITKFSTYEKVKKVIVTENGAAFEDRLDHGEVNDLQRTKYLQDYIGQVHRATKENKKVAGYFVWTFTDNFEWAEGYYPRFGLVHIDFKTQKRTVKASGKWYCSFLKESEVLVNQEKNTVSN